MHANFSNMSARKLYRKEKNETRSMHERPRQIGDWKIRFTCRSRSTPRCMSTMCSTLFDLLPNTECQLLIIISNGQYSYLYMLSELPLRKRLSSAHRENSSRPAGFYFDRKNRWIVISARSRRHILISTRSLYTRAFAFLRLLAAS